MIWNTVFLVAMDDELQRSFDLTSYQPKQLHGFSVYENIQAGLVIVKTGIGKSNAAAAAQFALQTYSAERYINTGLVGCFNREFKLAQVVVVDECCFFDVNVTVFGYEPGQLPGTEKARYSLDTASSSKLKLHLASLVSGDTFVHEDEHRQFVMKTFKPDIVDMELTSIAHVFNLHGKLAKLTAIKAISDFADGQSDSSFYQVMPKAYHNLKEVLANAK